MTETTYSDSAKGVRIDFERVAAEFTRHGLNVLDCADDFNAECVRGEDGLYDAYSVLLFLGY